MTTLFTADMLKFAIATVQFVLMLIVAALFFHQKVTDKRVSRSHAVLELTDGELTVLPVSQCLTTA